MKHQNHLALAAITFVFLLAAWTAFTAGKVESQEPRKLDGAGSPPPKIRDLSGGAKIQRQRIDRAINTASAVSVDEAIASLSEYNESYELAGLATMTSSSLGYCFMNSMLADRRISKIFEHLSSLPANEAN